MVSQYNILSQIAEEIAKAALQMKAICLNPTNPFTWTSGYKMPIYNDNRILLSSANIRKAICKGMANLISENRLTAEVIAGTATAGIPAATSLADLLELPLVYVRSKKKEHGKQNQIEGRIERGARVVLVEDLLSTGGSAISAVEALREIGAKVEACLSIFTYEFETCQNDFQKLGCNCFSLLGLSDLLSYARKYEIISENDLDLLERWSKAPFNWSKE